MCKSCGQSFKAVLYGSWFRIPVTCHFFVFWHFVSLRPDYVKKFFFCKILVWNERIETKNEAEVGLYLKTNAIVICECTIKATNHKWSAWKFYFWFQFGIHSFSHTIALWVLWIFVNGIAAAACLLGVCMTRKGYSAVVVVVAQSSLVPIVSLLHQQQRRQQQQQQQWQQH